MNKTLIILFLLCFRLGAYAQHSAEQEVLALERKWLNAYEQNDAAAMDHIVAEGFEIRFPHGRVETKADLVRMVQSNAGKPSNVKFYTKQTKVTIYPATAILRGIVVSEFMVGAEKRQIEQFYTDTWVRTEKGWQVVASHLSDLPKPGGDRKVNAGTSGTVKKEH